MTFVDSLNAVLRYHTNSDWYPELIHTPDATPHLGYADWLDDNGHPEAADHVRREAFRQQNGEPLTRPNQPEMYDKDFVLHSVRTAHPNPTVRGLAHVEVPDGRGGTQLHPDFFSFLLAHDPQSHSAEHDLAVYLHPHDVVRPPAPAAAALKKINKTHIYDAGGLFAKVVRGRVYLMDTENPDPRGHDSPSIVYDADADDAADLEAMVKHANAMVRQRIEERHIGPTQYGPATVVPAH